MWRMNRMIYHTQERQESTVPYSIVICKEEGSLILILLQQCVCVFSQTCTEKSALLFFFVCILCFNIVLWRLRYVRKCSYGNGNAPSKTAKSRYGTRVMDTVTSFTECGDAEHRITLSPCPYLNTRSVPWLPRRQ